MPERKAAKKEIVGSNDTATIDRNMSPTSFAVEQMTAVEEATLAKLVRKAVG